jgi:hypothetical protein
MAQVFISYVEEDSQTAVEIAHGLEAAGYSTWYYERENAPGPSYLEEIYNAILKAQALLVLVSPRSLESHQITVEVEQAHECAKPFLPVLFDLDHDELIHQPRWKMAFGTTKSIELPSEGISAILPDIVLGLQKLGIVPGAGQSETVTGPPASVRKRFRGKSRKKGIRILVASGFVAALFFGARWLYVRKMRMDLEARIGNAVEFSDAYRDGLKYWSTPASWRVEKEGPRLRVAGPGLGFLRDRIYGDFQASFDIELLNRKGAVWVLRAQDPQNYYLFQLSGPAGASANTITTFICKDGKLRQELTVNVSHDLGRPDDSIHLSVEAKGRIIRHTIQVFSQPDVGPQNLTYLDDGTFLYGGIGFGTKDGEEFRVWPIHVMPLKPHSNALQGPAPSIQLFEPAKWAELASHEFFLVPPRRCDFASLPGSCRSNSTHGLNFRKGL